MKHILVAVLLITCVPNYTPSQKESVLISDGFMKGQDYLDMDASEKRAYAMGVMNGMFVAPFFGAPEAKMEWIKACSANMGDEQIAAILTKYLRDNPGQWHYGMPALSFNAIRSACPKPR